MICVNSCGHNSHHRKPCDIEHKTGVPDYLILLIKQEASATFAELEDIWNEYGVFGKMDDE